MPGILPRDIESFSAFCVDNARCGVPTGAGGGEDEMVAG